MNVPIYEWMGGKARHSQAYGFRIMGQLPDNGHYYEGFAGAASVAIWLGREMPKINITLTETNPCVVNGLKYIRDDGKFSGIFKIMRDFIAIPDLETRRHRIEKYYFSEDPVEFLAAANSVRPSRNVWAYPPEKIIARMALVPRAFAQAKIGLRRAEILNEPMSARRCDVAYLDPPYYCSTFNYYAQKGDLEVWLNEIKKFQVLFDTKYILASDNIKAERFYKLLGFKFEKSGFKLGAGIKGNNVRDEDGFFEWKR